MLRETETKRLPPRPLSFPFRSALFSLGLPYATAFPSSNCLRSSARGRVIRSYSLGVGNSERGYHFLSEGGTRLKYLSFNEAVPARAATDIFLRNGLTTCLSDP